MVECLNWMMGDTGDRAQQLWSEKEACAYRFWREGKGAGILSRELLCDPASLSSPAGTRTLRVSKPPFTPRSRTCRVAPTLKIKQENGMACVRDRFAFALLCIRPRIGWLALLSEPWAPQKTDWRGAPYAARADILDRLSIRVRRPEITAVLLAWPTWGKVVILEAGWHLELQVGNPPGSGPCKLHLMFCPGYQKHNREATWSFC
ncbi:hypothetical protein QBC36DRAFT_26844 [Triangularia setosa]|uniref:Uncharacterized protein n=1 Tax=Triangularia setosa TaxID=2587417 RepID=A0AAN6WFZ4_9PEZI|nr:hypothetical protein QBC36DRAFT_26844 [Podospora setosa]